MPASTFTVARGLLVVELFRLERDHNSTGSYPDLCDRCDRAHEVREELILLAPDEAPEYCMAAGCEWKVTRRVDYLDAPGLTLWLCRQHAGHFVGATNRLVAR